MDIHQVFSGNSPTPLSTLIPTSHLSACPFTPELPLPACHTHQQLTISSFLSSVGFQFPTCLGLTDLTLLYLILCCRHLGDGPHLSYGPGLREQCILGLTVLCLDLRPIVLSTPIGLTLCGSSHRNDILHLRSHRDAGKCKH